MEAPLILSASMISDSGLACFGVAVGDIGVIR